MEKKFADVDGVRLAYLDTGGDAPAILFVHGNSVSAEAFELQLESELAGSFRLVSMDLPGHGDSARVPVSRYGLPFYGKCAAGLVSSLGLGEVVLVGWSLGGHIVLECAGNVPAARGLLIFGTPPLGFPPAMEAAFLPNPAFAAGMTGAVTAQQARDYAHSFLGDRDNPALEEVLARQILATDPNARDGLARSAGEAFVDEVELVGRLQKPLAVLHGGQERLVNLEYIESLSMPTLWRRRVQVIENAGHAPHLEAPLAFNGLLGEFAREAFGL